MCIKRVLLILLSFSFFLQELDAKSIVNQTIVAIVKISKAKVRDRAIPNDKYIVDYYSLGKVFYLDYCDKYDWCKIKNKNLYISKATIGVMKYRENQQKNQLTLTDTILQKNKKVDIKNKKCVKLKQINLNENYIFDKNRQKDLFSKYFGKCINIALLKKILDTASQYYLDYGYITTKPYLMEQDIKDGQLDISISKGLVENIVNSETNESDGRIKTAFISQKGNVLNLRDLETSLEMMNRVPSTQSKFEIVPGDEDGRCQASCPNEVHLSTTHL